MSMCGLMWGNLDHEHACSRKSGHKGSEHRCACGARYRDGDLPGWGWQA